MRNNTQLVGLSTQKQKRRVFWTQRLWTQVLAPREASKSQEISAMLLLNASVLPRNSLNRKLFWDLAWVSLLPQIRLLECRDIFQEIITKQSLHVILWITKEYVICNFREINSRKFFLCNRNIFFWKVIPKQRFMCVIFSGRSVSFLQCTRSTPDKGVVENVTWKWTEVCCYKAICQEAFSQCKVCPIDLWYPPPSRF